MNAKIALRQRNYIIHKYGLGSKQEILQLYVPYDNWRCAFVKSSSNDYDKALPSSKDGIANLTHKKARLSRAFLCLSCLQPVHQNIEAKPNYVNKVPVPSCSFKAKMLICAEVTFLQAQSDKQKHQHANEDVKTVKTRQHEEG